MNIIKLCVNVKFSSSITSLRTFRNSLLNRKKIFRPFSLNSVDMSQTSITSFFKKTPKVVNETNQDEPEQQQKVSPCQASVLPKRNRLESSSSDSSIINNTPTAKKGKRRRIESTSTESDSSQTKTQESNTPSPNKLNGNVSKVETLSPKREKGVTKISEQNGDSGKTDNSFSSSSKKSPKKKKQTPRSKENKKEVNTINFSSKKQNVSSTVDDKNTDDKKTEGAVAETEYDPAKAKYDPVHDACWSQGQPVPYLALARTLEAIEGTRARLRMVDILANYFLSVLELTSEDLLPSIYLCLNQLAPAYHNLELGVAETYLVKAISGCGGGAVALRAAAKRGALAEAAQAARRAQATLRTPKPLTVRAVLAGLRDVAHMKGHASVNKKIAKIQSLFTACRHCEAKYLIRCLEGKLRIGLAEQSLLQALGQAAAARDFTLRSASPPTTDQFKAAVEEAARQVKSAYAQCPEWERVAPALAEGGAPAVARECVLRVGVPPRPMLAHPARSCQEVFDRLEGSEVACEWKYDGERAQIHVPAKCGEAGEEVAPDLSLARVFSRNQEDTTPKYGDVVARLGAALGPAVTSCILDAEVVAWDPQEQAILPFQVLSTRRRKAGGAGSGVQAGGPGIQAGGAGDAGPAVCLFVFDLLLLNGRSLLDEELRERRRLLHEHFTPVPGSCMFAAGRDCAGAEAVAEWLEEGVRARCEGLMVKSLRSRYQVARRSRAWLKLKKDYLEGGGDSVDGVVIGAWRGKGRRGHTLGAFLLACRGPEGDLQALCRLGTGFSDAQLQDFTDQLMKLEIPGPKPYYRYDKSNPPEVWMEPSVVWEVRCADVTLSGAHCAARGLLPGGRAASLRFPRLVRARPDKGPDDATTARQIADMYLAQDNVPAAPAPDDDDDYY